MTERSFAAVRTTAQDGGTEGAVSVRVPATSANLGPGYDCFGLALQRFDDVTVTLCPQGLRVDVQGVGAGQVPTDAGHLVVRAMAKAWQATGRELPPVWLRCSNTIPHGGGQGSSAAAIVAGLLLGRGLLPEPARGLLPDSSILQLATDLEGHPDNVAPALLGGFTIAWTEQNGLARAVRRDVDPGVRAVVFTAAQASSTERSRALLPETVSHADAAANSARAALMVHALTTDPSYLLEATQDRLHQQYRASSMPESAGLVAELREAGIAAVISGAGPSVLALSTAQLELDAWRRSGFTAEEIGICRRGSVVDPL